uniref:glucuronosyltransferase n=1 Tax=Panagrellus redivivus TaxID=6233 RepID=A0A7E4VWY5_PANRE
MIYRSNEMRHCTRFIISVAFNLTMNINAKILVLLAFIATCCNPTSAAKILVVGTSNSKSHIISSGRIAEVLVKNGHNVTMANIEMGHSLQRFHGPKFSKIVHLGYVSVEEERQHVQNTLEKTKGVFDPVDLFKVHASVSKMARWFNDACENVLIQNSTALAKLKEEKFDALFLEHLSACGSALTEVLDIPVHFIVSSCPLFESTARVYGIDTPLGYLPAGFSYSFATDEMSFFQRARNLIEAEIVTHGWMKVYSGTTEVFRRHYGTDFPDVIDIMAAKTPFVFVAVDELIEFPRPLPPNVVNVGGLGIDFESDSNTVLHEPFATEMSKGAKGVVFFSMGSNANTAGFPLSVKKHLFGVMANFNDYHFILKLDQADAESRELLKSALNVYITPWAPQPAILRHPRLRVFVTHGGYNSILEVAHCGKPVLLLPMMFDQLRNAGVVERNGWGKFIDPRSLVTSKSKFEEGLREILYNENYTVAAKRIKKLLETKPFSADEIFIKHVNFALANGGTLPELKSVARNLNVIQQYNLDIWGMIIGGIGLVGVVVIKVVIATMARIRSHKLIQKTKQF